MPMPALLARQGRQAQPARQRQLLRSPPPHSIRRNSRTIQRRKDPSHSVCKRYMALFLRRV
uniref:Uncharacterized protein n=2 Tax=Oryza TaxID=4527 RepID=A0A0E0NWD0_ORYRU